MRDINPLHKMVVTNKSSSLSWVYGDKDSNIVIENEKLGVHFLRYAILSSDQEFKYDAIAIKEPKTNTVILVKNQEEEIGLLWEWRPIPEKWFWACPRGFGDPNDEDNIATAKRELIEEIGKCEIIESKKIGDLYQNTTFFEVPVGLVLLDVREIETKVSEEEGVIDFKFFPKSKILEMIGNNEIEDTFTLSALMKFFALNGLK